MSQGGIASGGALGSGIHTIAGAIGTATGTTVTFQVLDEQSPFFSAIGSTVTLVFTDTEGNTIIGDFSGSGSLDAFNNTSLGESNLIGITTGNNNVAIGVNVMQSATSAQNNVSIGTSSLKNIDIATNNVSIGAQSASDLVNGNFNVFLGASAGSVFDGSESSNIQIGYNVQGDLGESHICRIGVATGTGDGSLNATYIQGIAGRAVGNTNAVSIDATTGQLGSYPLGGAISYTPVSFGSSPYTALATDVYISADVTGGAITIRLPNAPTAQRVFIVKDQIGNALVRNITVTTVGGAVLIDGAASKVINTNYGFISVIFNGLSYELF